MIGSDSENEVAMDTDEDTIGGGLVTGGIGNK
jgi:hypothetical protein